MKSILVPTGGSGSDHAVFETALAAARPFAAHLHFLHVHVGAGQAAVHVPHTAFARGPALTNALAELDAHAASRSAAAAAHVRDFCASTAIEMRATPGRQAIVTASWQEAESGPARPILSQARHHDLTVVGRANRPNGLPQDFLELLVVGSGRPVLIAGPSAPRRLTGTIMIGWRESAEAARAVAAAMPLLVAAERVVVVSVGEPGDGAALSGVANQLAWSGIAAKTRMVAADGQATPAALQAAAQACAADLVVLGAYGHSRMRELLFGGCTRTFMEHADRPVLLMH